MLTSSAEGLKAASSLLFGLWPHFEATYFGLVRCGLYLGEGVLLAGARWMFHTGKPENPEVLCEPKRSRKPEEKVNHSRNHEGPLSTPNTDHRDQAAKHLGNISAPRSCSGTRELVIKNSEGGSTTVPLWGSTKEAAGGVTGTGSTALLKVRQPPGHQGGASASSPGNGD